MTDTKVSGFGSGNVELEIEGHCFVLSDDEANSLALDLLNEVDGT